MYPALLITTSILENAVIPSDRRFDGRVVTNICLQREKTIAVLIRYIAYGFGITNNSDDSVVLA